MESFEQETHKIPEIAQKVNEIILWKSHDNQEIFRQEINEKKKQI